MRNVLDQAQAAVDGGADALFVHGRTREARYRFAADWDAIGDGRRRRPRAGRRQRRLLFPQDVDAHSAASPAAAGVMSARGVLIKPWLFREMNEGYRDLTAEERVAIYRRYVTLAREHWGADAHGLERVRQFTRWHIDFWHRYVPRHEDGSFPSLQVRESMPHFATPLDAFLARTDDAAHEYLADCLTFESEIDSCHTRLLGAAAESLSLSRPRADDAVRVSPVNLPSTLELFQRLRPVVLQQARQRRDRRAVCRRSGTSDSNWLRSRVLRCAESACRKRGMACRNGRARPCPRGTRSPFPEISRQPLAIARHATSSGCSTRSA